MFHWGKNLSFFLTTVSYIAWNNGWGTVGDKWMFVKWRKKTDTFELLIGLIQEAEKRLWESKVESLVNAHRSTHPECRTFKAAIHLWPEDGGRKGWIFSGNKNVLLRGSNIQRLNQKTRRSPGDHRADRTKVPAHTLLTFRCWRIGQMSLSYNSSPCSMAWWWLLIPLLPIHLPPQLSLLNRGKCITTGLFSSFRM